MIVCCFKNLNVFLVHRDQVHNFIQKKNFMKENGMLVKEVVGVVCIMRMDLCMKESGVKIKEVDKEFTNKVLLLLLLAN